MKIKIAFFLLILALSTTACFGVKKAELSLDELELNGHFESKKGVMHTISCHGYNIGYLTFGAEKVVVCFDRLKNAADLEIDCSEIKVKGHYEEHTVAGGEGVCQGGTMTVFYVSEWSCK